MPVTATPTRTAWIAAAVYAVVLTYLLLAPHPLWLFGVPGQAVEETIDRSIAGYVQHALAYALLASLLAWACRTESASRQATWALLAVGHGALAECLQSFIPHRYADWPDGLANALGVGVGWLAVSLMLRAGNKPARESVACLLLALLFQPALAASASDAPRPAVGVSGNVGCLNDPKTVQRLFITEPGVYENYLVDGRWVNRNLVKINAVDVTLRNCEIRNGRNNAVTVYAANVLIENCKIHHLLAGTFRNQEDAHGITGRPTNLVIRNCEIHHVSGDAVQFDPDRGEWDNVLIENCTFWTGPLPADAAGFRRGERPGENAIDTKQRESNPRSRMTIRNCLLYGWGDGQITNQAALNLKNHVRVEVVGCVLAENDIGFRLRGHTGDYGGAMVTLRDCAVYRSKIAVRMEDAIENLTIFNLGIGEGVERKYQTAAGEPRAYVNEGEFVPPPYSDVIQKGVHPPK
ncbi:MAG: right-handed parallel beta-helix repeat-containing protein [Planctomycetota bacterium]